MLTIDHTHVVYSMSKDHPPVLNVPSGSLVRFETCDCFEDQITAENTVFNELDWSRINPATGPVYVNDAAPGDILEVEILNISLTRSHAVMVTAPNLGVLGAEMTQATIRLVPIVDDHAVLPGHVQWPIKPMIGVIGVAPAGDPIACGVPDAHGGNMDCKLIVQGATLWLPVNVPGALFALGDLHAAMGDGEVSVCGLEISGQVDVKLTLHKQKQMPTPMLTNQQGIYAIASALTLDEAALMATRQMAHFITQQTSLSLPDAMNLLSITGNIQICQMVDPLRTCRFELPWQVAKQLNISI